MTEFHLQPQYFPAIGAGITVLTVMPKQGQRLIYFFKAKYKNFQLNQYLKKNRNVLESKNLYEVFEELTKLLQNAVSKNQSENWRIADQKTTKIFLRLDRKNNKIYLISKFT